MKIDSQSEGCGSLFLAQDSPRQTWQGEFVSTLHRPLESRSFSLGINYSPLEDYCQKKLFSIESLHKTNSGLMTIQ